MNYSSCKDHKLILFSATTSELFEAVMSMCYHAPFSCFLALVSCLSSSLAHLLHLPLLSDHLALRSVLIVNEISLSVLKFLQLILLLLHPLFILSPLKQLFLLSSPLRNTDSWLLPLSSSTIFSSSSPVFQLA